MTSPRLEWIAAMEAARTAAQLSVCLRQLDAVLQVSSKIAGLGVDGRRVFERLWG